MKRKYMVLVFLSICLIFSFDSFNSGFGVYWDDLRFPLGRSFQGVLDKPDYDYDDLGLLFPQDDTTEFVTIIGQLPHTWIEGSDLRPHVHWIQTSADTPTWKLKYRWYNIGDTIPSSWTIIGTRGHARTWTAGGLLNISNFGVIPAKGKTISSNLDMIIYRKDNVVTGDVLAKDFDIHFQYGTGSGKEYQK